MMGGEEITPTKKKKKKLYQRISIRVLKIVTTYHSDVIVLNSQDPFFFSLEISLIHCL
jgi:hypothetical protein